MLERQTYDEMRFTESQATLAIQATWRDTAVFSVAMYVVWALAPMLGILTLVGIVGTGPALTCIATLMYRQRRQWRAHYSRWAVYSAGLLMPLWWFPLAEMLGASGSQTTGGEWLSVAAAAVFVPVVAVVERSAVAAGIAAVGGVLAVLPMLLPVHLSRSEGALLIPTVMTMVVAGIAAGNQRYIRSRVVQPGHCRACGYEAGTLGTCPECAGSVEPVGTSVS